MKLKNIEKCPVCSREQFFEIYKEENVPVILNPLSGAEIKMLKRIQVPESIPLVLGMCLHCTHVFMLKQPDSSFFEELYSRFYATHIARIRQQLGRDEFTSLLDMLSKQFKRVKQKQEDLKTLEIGCFDGYLMSVLARQGIQAYGCDPGMACQTGIDAGLNIESAFFTRDVFKGIFFDCIYSRHVLEHMAEPVLVLKTCFEKLNDDGAVLVEVPDGDTALGQGCMYPFHIEHLSTFTSASLACAFQEAGYRVVDVFNGDHSQIVVGMKQKPGGYDMFDDLFRREKILASGRQFSDNICRYNTRLGSFIKSMCHPDTNIAVWGAGALGIRFLNAFARTINTPLTIVDSAETKRGLSFYSCPELMVQAPSSLLESPVDYIVVASQFYKEIVSDIRNGYKLDIPILLLTPEIRVV